MTPGQKEVEDGASAGRTKETGHTDHESSGRVRPDSPISGRGAGPTRRFCREERLKLCGPFWYSNVVESLRYGSNGLEVEYVG